MTKQILLTLALAGACGITADAEIINVQFGCTAGASCTGGASSTAYTGAFAVGQTGDYWNMVVGDSQLGVTSNGTPRNLYNTTYTGSGAAVATIEWDAASHMVATGAAAIPNTSVYANLLNTYIRDSGSVSTNIYLHGLAANGYYTIYMINQAAIAGGNIEIYGIRSGTLISGVTTTSAASAGSSTTTPTLNDNYDQLVVQANQAGDISINVQGGTNTAINGMQIVTPEPGTVVMALGGLALVGIGRIRRNRQA